MASADHVLAGTYGVAPSVITALRADLTLGEHWLCADGKVAFTDLGRLAIEAALGLEKKEGGAAAPLPSPAPAGPVLLVIVEVCANPQWVRVRTPENDTARVRVTSNKNLRKRVQLRCQLTGDTWVCVQPGLAMRA
ncbi:MAG TPA: hypothetical protein VGE39_17370 [Prosthecobacter sp.]